MAIKPMLPCKSFKSAYKKYYNCLNGRRTLAIGAASKLRAADSRPGGDSSPPPGRLPRPRPREEDPFPAGLVAAGNASAAGWGSSAPAVGKIGYVKASEAAQTAAPRRRGELPAPGAARRRTRRPPPRWGGCSSGTGLATGLGSTARAPARSRAGGRTSSGRTERCRPARSSTCN